MLHCFLCHSCSDYYKETNISTQDVAINSTEESTESKEVFDNCVVNTVDILSSIPEFSGEAYIVINANVPFFTEEEKNG